MRYLAGILVLLLGAWMILDGNNAAGWLLCLVGLAALGVINLNSGKT